MAKIFWGMVLGFITEMIKEIKQEVKKKISLALFGLKFSPIIVFNVFLASVLVIYR